MQKGGAKKKAHNVTFPSLSPDTASPKGEEGEDNDALCDVSLPPISVDIDTSAVSHDALLSVNNGNLNPNIASCNVTHPSLPEHQETETALHNFDCNHETSVDLPREKTGGMPASIFNQLEQIDYSGEQGDSEGESSDECDNNNEDRIDEVAAEKANTPDLHFVTQLSWPTILQYVKESESKMNQYFSLENKETVETRAREAKAMLRDDVVNSAGSCGDDEGSTGTERDGSSCCHFCGRKLPWRSLLADSQDIEKMKEQVSLGAGMCNKELRTKPANSILLSLALKLVHL